MVQIKRREQVASSSYNFSADILPRLQQIYASRNAFSDDDISIELKSLLPPSAMKGITEAVERLLVAFKQQQRIIIIGDFDADGATSSALAVLSLRAMGCQHVDFLVPDRFKFGYGLSPAIVDEAQQFSPDLIITVDNGISSVDGVARANSLGVDVIVTDHHLPGAELPAAVAIVNPNQKGCTFPSKSIAGVGVLFYLVSALRSGLRELNWFETNNIPEPILADYLDLVALGTVADVVPLDKNNRILVEQGLRRIRSGKTRPGILSLLESAGKDINTLVSSDLGFTLGPRLNAAGRLDDMSIGIQCLLTEDYQEARSLATTLSDLNSDRRAIEASMTAEALSILSKINLSDSAIPFGISLFDDSWHQGVIGIVASRIKDKYHRPVIAFAPSDNVDEIKGSARSIKGFHIRDALDAVAAQHPGLLKKFGGHAMAAGMTIAKQHYEEFSEAFDRQVRAQLVEDDLTHTILTDGELSEAELALDFAKQLKIAGPWGQNFPEPVFDGRFDLIDQRIVGGKHLKCRLGYRGSNIIDAIAFNINLEQWPDESVKQIDIAYRLDVNTFRQRESLQLIISEIFPVG